jgi:hypothetical protein
MTPIYIVSKGRADCHTTSAHLCKMRRPHWIVVEPCEVDAYRATAGEYADVLPMDLSFKATYQLLDDRGMTASTGPGPARNFAWEHAKAEGHNWHWVMDDNIDGFFRLNRNLKIPCRTSRMLDAMQDFCERFPRVVMAGPAYFRFAPRRNPLPPFIHNTRIYSCNLIRCDAAQRWRGRYNEDTILSLDMLKAGLDTVQFNAFLQRKMDTQALKGGNTGEFYASEGTYLKSKMLEDAHPDVARVAWRFSREHHHVDYSRFQRRRLAPRDGWRQGLEPVNEYGMRLQVQRDCEWLDVTANDNERKYAASITLDD